MPSILPISFEKNTALHKLSGHLYNGIWALFCISILLAAFLILVHINQLFFIIENFQADSYDTILSIKWMSEYGMFGNVPYFSDPYSLFGNWPVLFAFLGSVLNAVLNDASVSAAVLYWLTDIAIAFLIWTRFLKRCTLEVKAAFLALFLMDVLLGNIFPLGFRKRQQLAILMGLLMFLMKNIWAELLFALAALLAQPFAGGLLIALNAVCKADRRDFMPIAALIVPLIMAYPFYSNLLGLGSAMPQYSGCAQITQMSYPTFEVLFILAVLLFYLSNKGRCGLLEYASLGICCIYPALLISFLLFKDIAPSGLLGSFLTLTSTACPENFFNVAAVGMLLSVSLKNMRLPKASISLILLLAVSSLVLASFALFGLVDDPAFAPDVFHTLESTNMTKLKSMELLAMDYSGELHIKPLMTLFAWQGHSILHPDNLTFVDEFNMPPQLSKGESNIPMAALPQAIYDNDIPACSAMSAELRERGVQALVYHICTDMTTPSDYQPENFLDPDRMESCGLTILLNKSSSKSVLVIYRLADE
ncbi:hypothetical protein H0O00_02480 [Candidatus Micrarchaeota archaeon]|nr:hypothetical protein [Candidatus Micrarchaeota archaeon]